MSKEYDAYLDEHIAAVGKAAHWMVEHLQSVQRLPDEQIEDFLLNVGEHDRSKYDLVEYMPYDAYFYGTPNEEAFNVAWLHHIHRNPHHWQHWVLVNDDGEFGEPGKVVALEMPITCVLEMVADWWSFSWRSGNLREVFGWYEDRRGCIVLHEDTRRHVEGLLDEIGFAISELYGL